MKNVTWLFDIDGTLIRSGGAGSSAMAEALATTFGVPPETRGVSFAGCTDRGIVLELFQVHGIAPSENRIQEFYDCYLNRLEIALQEKSGSVLPGVLECLDECVARGDTLGLLTGNMYRAAKLKLQHFGLWSYFRFGGYGDKFPSRDSVAAEALKSAERFREDDQPFRPDRVFVVGDTPNDIQCARANGMKVVSVSTGEHSAEELESHQPDFLVQSLQDCPIFVTISENT